jgi:hypothetical protein
MLLLKTPAAKIGGMPCVPGGPDGGAPEPVTPFQPCSPPVTPFHAGAGWAPEPALVTAEDAGAEAPATAPPAAPAPTAPAQAGVEAAAAPPPAIPDIVGAEAAAPPPPATPDQADVDATAALPPIIPAFIRTNASKPTRATAATGTPTPIPALAPVDSPLLPWLPFATHAAVFWAFTEAK